MSSRWSSVCVCVWQYVDERCPADEAVSVTVTVCWWEMSSRWSSVCVSDCDSMLMRDVQQMKQCLCVTVTVCWWEMSSRWSSVCVWLWQYVDERCQQMKQCLCVCVTVCWWEMSADEAVSVCDCDSMLMRDVQQMKQCLCVTVTVCWWEMSSRWSSVCVCVWLWQMLHLRHLWDLNVFKSPFQLSQISCSLFCFEHPLCRCRAPEMLWAELSRFHLKTESESSFRNVVV
jgi:hypothetical protein